MNINMKLYAQGEKISFVDAIAMNFVTITENGLHVSDGIEIYTSSGLFDKRGKEVFENDILINNYGKEYDVIKLKGTFFIKERGKSQGGLSATLSGIKYNNKIYNMEVKAEE